MRSSPPFSTNLPKEIPDAKPSLGFIAGFNWVDSLLNAAMILTGMGPVGALTSDASKLFASAYALFSGVVFITAAGILLTPIFHRVLHRFHIEVRDLR
jgi:hypothetical protein